MAGLRDFVTGSDVCAPNGAGPSNAAASLADVLLGGRSKQQQQLHELPGRSLPGQARGPATYTPPTASQAAEAAIYNELPAIPGLHPAAHPSVQSDVDAFLRGSTDHDRLQHEFESIYSSSTPQQQQHFQGAPLPHGMISSPATNAVAPFLQAFFDSGKTQAPFHPRMAAGPAASSLSVGDKCRIRDRSTILARHVFADRGNVFADEQVSKLLSSLNIDPSELPAQADMAAWDRIYAAGNAREHATAAAAQNARPIWVDEFENMRIAQHGKTPLATTTTESRPWAEEYSASTSDATPSQQEGLGAANSWVDEYKSIAEAGSVSRQSARASGGDAIQHTRQLAETLSSNQDPKFQNSKFLQFVSKMSRGELIMEDNQVKEVPAAARQWIDEFTTTNNNSTTIPGAARTATGPSLWGEEFASFQANQHPHMNTGQRWAESFQAERQGHHLQPEEQQQSDWADQFADQFTNGGAWATEFATSGLPGADVANWEEEYLNELERLHDTMGPRSAGEYQMSDDNPFLLDIDSYSTGKELFRKGLLSEAVLALEAECQRNPNNSEAWRLLGTVQAENDDDQQAIAAMNKALSVDPENLEVLLALGVSHTNELDQREALNYLRQWLLRHYTYGAEARQVPPPPESSQVLSHTVRLFSSTARSHPQDADVQVALGVLCNLARHYDEAVNAFHAALALRPTDYSLWNKLGATLANSGRSGEAVAAYQKALDLKPNYMRAWTNMGISLANLGDYEGSARYYVRALSLNPRADAVWGYLTTTLACLGAVGQHGSALEGRDVDSLAAAFPL